jgi:hypothetical protein
MGNLVTLSFTAGAIGWLAACSGARPEPVRAPATRSTRAADASRPDRSCPRPSSPASPRHFLELADRQLESRADRDPCRALDVPLRRLVDLSADTDYVHPDGRRAPPPATCRDYLALVEDGFFDDTPAGSHAEQQFHRTCAVLVLLSRAGEPTRSHVRGFSLSRDGLRSLPLAVGDVHEATIDPTHLGVPLSANGTYRRCVRADPDPRRLCLYWTTDDPADRTGLMLSHVATGDFDRDGLEDIAVWASGQSGGASPEETGRLFVLTRRGGGLLELLAVR